MEESTYYEATTLGKLIRYVGAIETYKSIIAIDANYAKAYFSLGELTSCILHNCVESIQHYMKAIEVDPCYLDAYENLMMEFSHISKMDIGKHIQLKQEEDLYWEAKEYVVLKKYSKVIKKLEEAIKINKTSVLSYAIMGDIFRKNPQGKAKAIEWYKKAVQTYLILMPEDYIVQVRQKLFDDSPALLKMVTTLVEEGKHEEVITWLTSESERGNIYAQFFRGTILYQMNDITTAMECYFKAAVQGHVKSCYNLGDLFCKRYENVKEACYWYLKAAYNGDEQAQTNLGVILEKQGNIKDAKIWYEKAAEQNDHKAQYNLGVLLEKSGNIEDAKKWYKKAAQQDNVSALFNLGLFAAKEGKTKEAAKWWGRAAELGDMESYDNLNTLRDIIEACEG